MAAAQATRRREYLDGIADTALDQEDDDTARRKAIEDRQEAAEKLRRENAIKREAARESWLEAVEQMQDAAKEFVAALERGLEAAADERAAGPGERSGVIQSDTGRCNRISRYLSAEIRRVIGPTGARFGELRLTTAIPRPVADWQEQERRATGDRPTIEELTP